MQYAPLDEVTWSLTTPRVPRVGTRLDVSPTQLDDL